MASGNVAPQALIFTCASAIDSPPTASREQAMNVLLILLPPIFPKRCYSSVKIRGNFGHYRAAGGSPGNEYRKFTKIVLSWADFGAPAPTDQGSRNRYAHWPIRLIAPHFGSFQIVLLKPNVISCT